MADRYVLPAVPVLRKWLKSQGLSLTRFCEENDLDRIQVQRAVNGERQKISVEFAAEIETATDGKVGWRLWIPPRRVREERRERHSSARVA